MSIEEIYRQFIVGIQGTRWFEYVAVAAGIASVWYSRKENVLVYPVGLINTIIFVFISIEGKLLGEASVNIYYTIMSIYGWWLWTKKNDLQEHVLKISTSNKVEWAQQLAFFSFFYLALFFSLTYLKNAFFPGAIPWADAFASASAYTGMWLMAKKKLENWYWWILTDVASVPLYFSKGYVFTSFQFFVFTAMAIWGLVEWQKKLNRERVNNIYTT